MPEKNRPVNPIFPRPLFAGRDEPRPAPARNKLLNSPLRPPILRG